MKIIKELRLKRATETGKKMSQGELAKALNVSRSTVAMWETDGSIPDITSLQALADFFNVSTDFLLGRERIAGNQPQGVPPNSPLLNAEVEHKELSFVEPELQEIAELYGQLPDDKKALVLAMARAMVKD